MRVTETDLLDASESQLKDHWPHPVTKSLSDHWMGTTTFFMRMPPPNPGYKWVAGRQVQIKKGTMTETIKILPEIWTSMSPQQRQRAFDLWGVESKKR